MTADWKSSLKRRVNKHTGEPEITPSLTNAVLLLSHDEAFAGCYRRNLLSGDVELVRALPNGLALRPPDLGALTEYHPTYTVAAIQHVTKTTFPLETTRAAIEAAAEQDPFNPLHDYLSGLVWDGTPRVELWLSNYLGAPPTRYVNDVGRWWLISAIARAFRPGCKVDHTLLLRGAQGAKKSTAAAILGGEFTLQRLPSVRDYDRAAHALAGHWIVEIAELDSFRGAAASQIKEFLTLTQDYYRPPYARYHVTRQRTCVMIGTTNEDSPLRDATGGRRFWPVEVRELNRPALERDRDQLWAEAVHLFRAGERWWPEVQGERQEVEAAQEDAYDEDAWEPRVADWIAADVRRSDDGFTTGEVLGGAIGLEPGKWSRAEQTRIGSILHRLGYETRRLRCGNGRERRYFRIGKES